MEYKVGTRGSKLALKQTEEVIEMLKEIYPQHSFRTVIIETKGDKDRTSSLKEIGGQGVFVKEIERRLRDMEIDMAVHSSKDVPSLIDPLFELIEPWIEEDDRDVLVMKEEGSFDDLPAGAVIATGSVRRKRQLLKLRSDISVVDIRGNIDTRIRKMRENGYDGIVLAQAGLKRLGMHDLHTYVFSHEEMVPSVTQGIIAIEIRKDDEIKELFRPFRNEEVAWKAEAERSFLKEMNASCKDVIGAYTEGHTLHVVYATENSELLYAEASDNDPKVCALQCAKKIRSSLNHKVMIVGAGIGSKEYLTLKAKQAIESADCILYDRLIAQDILALAKKDCECIYVGKKEHLHTLKQEEISCLLAEKAMQYQCVVRLKGGDPYIFGRGGEEVQYLREKGIPVEVIPGISSSLAAPLLAGIPLTHRGISQGFTVMTAVNRHGDLSHIDFESLAKSKNTLVFLMGLSHLEEIATNLITCGMDMNTKAAVISNAGCESEAVACGSLLTIKEEVKKTECVSPAVIVVGEVVKFHELFYAKKTEEKRKEYHVVKIGKEVSRLTEELRKDAVVHEIQVSEIRYCKCEMTRDDLACADTLLFASKHGVHGMMKALGDSDIRELYGKKIVTTGEKTKEVLRSYGLCTDDVVKSKEEMLKKYGDRKCLLFSSEDRMYGKHIRSVKVYENVPTEKRNIRIAEDAAVIFTASSSVERFLSMLDEEDRQAYTEHGTAYSIGAKTSATLIKNGMKKIVEARTPSYESLLAKVKEDR